MQPIKVFVDMDGVLCDFDARYAALRAEYPEIQYPQSIPGFFRNLPPMSYGLIVMQKWLESTNIDPYILTAPSTKNLNSLSEKAEWVESWLGYEWLDRMIITSRKDLLVQENSLLIDDYNTEKNGQSIWEQCGRLIHFGVGRYSKGWVSVEAAINTMLERRGYLNDTV